MNQPTIPAERDARRPGPIGPLSVDGGDLGGLGT
jgi:hypothetical protein